MTCPMVFEQMQSTLLETVGKKLHVPKYPGAPDAHVDPFCHLPTSLVIRLHSSIAFVLGTTEIPPQQKPFLVLSFTFKGSWTMTAKPQRGPSSQLTNCHRVWSTEARRTSHSQVAGLHKCSQQSFQSTSGEEV